MPCSSLSNIDCIIGAIESHWVILRYAIPSDIIIGSVLSEVISFMIGPAKQPITKKIV